jgi:hypothetical protein
MNHVLLRCVFGVAVFVAVFAAQIVNAGSIEKRDVQKRDVQKRDVQKDAENEFNQLAGGVYGSTCFLDSDCSAISYCKKTSDISLVPDECSLVWWFILILVLINSFLLCSIVSCLFCPCCFLYSLGKTVFSICPRSGSETIGDSTRLTPSSSRQSCCGL